MTSSVSSSSEPAQSWQDVQYRWAAIPGWSLSVIVHAVLLFVLSTQLNSCGGSLEGTSEGSFRSVGLVVREDQSANFTEPESPSEHEPQNDQRVERREPELTEVPDRPPIEPVLPDLSPRDILGAGSELPLPGGLTETVESVLQPATGSVPFEAAAGIGPGDIPFIGAVDRGTTFIYIIDNSGSMGAYDALKFAKAELMASLQAMNATQKFFVMFYNERVTEMNIGKRPGEPVPATDVNRNLVKRFIGEVRAQMGTRHVPALTRALEMKPDVIFFLTDADQPVLTAAELDTIKKLNRGGTRIHCVEFGMTPPLKVDNFLKRLARQNGGTHSYRDVTQLYRQQER
jgi:hypothetical protein